MKKKAYMINDRIFFSVEKMKKYLLDTVHVWEESGCHGTQYFPKVKIGNYEVKEEHGRLLKLF